MSALKAISMLNEQAAIKFGISGIGRALPMQVVSSTELDALVERERGWTESTFGIKNRYWAHGSETSSALGAQAARVALAEADWPADSLDVIVGASAVTEQPIPGNAPMIQQNLGLGASGISAFDVNATCLSFLVAFDIVLAGFVTGRWRRALVVSSEIASAALDFRNPEASVIFGDGALAVALSAGGPHRLLASRHETYGDGRDLCTIGAGGTRLRPHDNLENFLAKSKFQMDGHGVFRATARPFPAFLGRLLAAAETDASELGSVIPHQASATALEHLKRAIPDGHAKTIDIFADYGNQIAVSLPHALHAARAAGRLKAGSRSLLIGTSAGVSLGGAVIEW
jgi:3-oxoacyl-[acyl-carrier-protein] synthase-3